MKGRDGERWDEEEEVSTEKQKVWQHKIMRDRWCTVKLVEWIGVQTL